MIDVMLKSAPIVPYIPATDVARARKFYEEKVGLVPKEEVAGGVVYECGKRSWSFLYQSAGQGCVVQGQRGEHPRRDSVPGVDLVAA